MIIILTAYPNRIVKLE